MANWSQDHDLVYLFMCVSFLADGEVDDSEKEAVSDEFFYIATDKCTECIGFHEEPQCAAVCPVDCCIDDPDYRESEDELLAKKDFMHL